MNGRRDVPAPAIAGFSMPYVASKHPRVGRQPFMPGQSQMDSGGPVFNPLPWPVVAPLAMITLLANSPGDPRSRPVGIDNNATAALPTNSMFIAGIVGKSRG